MPAMKSDRRKVGDVIRCRSCGRLIDTGSYQAHVFFCVRERREAFGIDQGVEVTIVNLPRGDAHGHH